MGKRGPQPGMGHDPYAKYRARAEVAEEDRDRYRDALLDYMADIAAANDRLAKRLEVGRVDQAKRRKDKSDRR